MSSKLREITAFDDRPVADHIFVYGTLKRGEVRERILKALGCTFVTEATLTGFTLHDAAGGAYPAMFEDEQGKVIGEVWTMPTDDDLRRMALRDLDAVEAVDVGLYVRRVELASASETGAEFSVITYVAGTLMEPRRAGMPHVGQFWTSKRTSAARRATV